MMGDRFEEVQAKINVFLEQYPKTEWGPAHNVLSDYNLEDHYIWSVIRDLADFDDISDEDYQERLATLKFLVSLFDIPEDDRCPTDFDDT